MNKTININGETYTVFPTYEAAKVYFDREYTRIEDENPDWGVYQVRNEAHRRGVTRLLYPLRENLPGVGPVYVWTWNGGLWTRETEFTSGIVRVGDYLILDASHSPSGEYEVLRVEKA